MDTLPLPATCREKAVENALKVGPGCKERTVSKVYGVVALLHLNKILTVSLQLK